MKNKNIRVVELFAGVGGFRLGLEGWNGKSCISGYREELDSNYEVVWSNQWEPSTKVQHASAVYENRWGYDNHRNDDIETIAAESIPDHDLLVGGFPCQDYSVASTLKTSKGIAGKKGVLWWSIHRILRDKKNKPKYLFLENVDRLLKSPASQRGRDFAIMLKSLSDLGYAVEWRVINAAEYGFPQRRRRIYIVGYHKSTDLYKKLKKGNNTDWLLKDGVIADAFPVTSLNGFTDIELKGDLQELTETFGKGQKVSQFLNSGLMIDGKVSTLKVDSKYNGAYTLLKDVLIKGKVSSDFYIDGESLEKWTYLKGAKKEERETKDGFKYNYAEGGMIFPDNLENASRTIITGEGGASASRFKHVVETKEGLRRLTPVELERLNMFPDNHTEMKGITDTKRAFFMGNALVVGIVERIGKSLTKFI